MKISRTTRVPRVAGVLHGLLEVIEVADHRNAADRLAAIREGRRQDADRAHLTGGAALDRAQQDLGIGRAAEHQARNGVAFARVVLGADMAEVPVGDARSRQECDLQEPVEQDRGLAEEVRAIERGRDQHIVEHEQRDRQHRRGAHDIAEIGHRGEAPLGAVQAEHEEDAGRIDQEAGQDPHRARRDATPGLRASKRI